ncbi:pyrroline-5-carboxylate reductase [Hoeflea sp. CAU 1731]
MTEMSSAPIVLVGAGNMGGAMLAGWLASDTDAGSLVIVDPAPSPAVQVLIDKHGLRHEKTAPSDVKAAIVFLAVKPQMMEAVLPTLAGLIGDYTLCISIAAGTTVSTIQSFLGDISVVRAMPNTPAMVGRGITGAWANAAVSPVQRDFADRMLSVTGPVEWVEDEPLIDAITAVSGSGPAYVFYLVECMAEAGRRAGLDEDIAMRLARATVSGAGELMHRSDDPAATLRKNVTSPGGTTAAALDVLMGDDAMQDLLTRAVAAAKKRAGELAG